MVRSLCAWQREQHRAVALRLRARQRVIYRYLEARCKHRLDRRACKGKASCACNWITSAVPPCWSFATHVDSTL